MKKNSKINEKSEKPRRRLLRILAAAAAIFVVLSIASFPFKTVYYTIYTDKVSENVRIAQVSDLHSCRYGKDMSSLLDAIDGASPDFIVLTGDIYDEVVNNDNTRTFLKAAVKKYTCLYVAGNHENKKGDWNKFRLEAESFGVRVLEGENVDICGVTICGAAPTSDKKVTFADTVEMCAEKAADGYNILLAHFPEEIHFYRSFGKFDLVLAGHAHGGQWRIPGLINGVFSPSEGIFPKYAGGRYDFDDCTMIVSRGLRRTDTIVPRIMNNPELVIIDIKNEDSNEH